MLLSLRPCIPGGVAEKQAALVAGIEKDESLVRWTCGGGGNENPF